MRTCKQQCTKCGNYNEATFDGKAAGGMDEHSRVCGMFELTPKMTEDAERALKAYGMEVVGPHSGLSRCRMSLGS